eukprot:1176729-Prorocentrum_minimum.AAC.6
MVDDDLCGDFGVGVGWWHHHSDVLSSDSRRTAPIGGCSPGAIHFPRPAHRKARSGHPLSPHLFLHHPAIIRQSSYTPPARPPMS